ncbi:MAG: RNA polymerase sigma factor [Chitinophagaceae bacterium]
MTEKDYNDCVRRYADNVFRFIVKNLQHEENARDIIQSSFEKLWVNRAQVEPEKSKSYLFTVAYRLMIDFLRKHSRTQLTEDFAQDSRTVDQPDTQLRKILDEALQRLSDIQRSLVLLKDYEGYSYEEIGTIANLSSSQVKVYLHRARLAMRAYLVGMHYVL